MQFKTICAAAALAGALGVAGTAQAATELNASIWFPDSQPLTRYGYLEWAKAVDKASGGDLKINVFTGTSLLPPAAHLSGLRDGVAHLTYHAGTYTPSDLPEVNVIAMLGISMKEPLTTALAVADFSLNDPEMQALWKKQKIVFLGAYASDIYNLICSKEVSKLDDLKGLKFRTPGKIHAEWVRTVGGTPVTVPSSEIFTGLDKGQLDCAVMGSNDLKARSLWDVAKYVNLANTGPYYAGWEWAMHGPTWRKLSVEHRRILLDTIADATIDTELAYLASVDTILAEAPSKGVTVIEPSDDINKSLQEFGKQARATAVQEGTEQFKLKDAEGLVARFEATMDKWNKLMEGVDRKDAAALKTLFRTNVYDKIDAKTYGQ